MTLQTIEAWIANPNRDYKTGLEIYNEYKINKQFDNFFNVQDPAPGSMQFKMLFQRVCDIARKVKQNPKLVKPDPITVRPIDIDGIKKNKLQALRPTVVDNPIINPAELPEDLQQLYFANKTLTREISVLHQELKAVHEGKQYDAARKAIANQLADKDKERFENWKQIDTWWRENKLKTEEEKAAFDKKKEDLRYSLKEAKKILDRIESIKININRTKKVLTKRPELQEKITAWEKELVALEEKVK